MSTSRISLTTPAFQQGAAIPSRYTCDGKDISPPLLIAGSPSATRSLALIVDDPDAPAGIWSHWLVWNIDPSTSLVPEGSTPPGSSQGTNDFRKRDYRGPCPPSGRHRYFFRLYALDQRLDLPPGANRSSLLNALEGHIISQTELMGTYARTAGR